MERKVKFVPDEYYHLFSRGVEKRKIFLDKKDYDRFLALLYILNQEDHFHVSNFLNKGQKNILDLYKQERGQPLVSILAYSLMPNHFHLVVQEIIEGGISTFMMKLLTACSMYFNTKYERSGSLFVHPFRSEHIGDDAYFRYLFAYVHLNCIELFEKGWKENGIKNQKRAKEFLENYRYSSYQDLSLLTNRPEARILDMDNLPEDVSRVTLDIREYQKWYKSGK
ncbi:MAG: Transposase [Parcubacteria group bacterium GW2011_GWF2_44_8b]|nr:MAG: Transposase [Parcubacteria group bacterium GW2011_GWC1_43_30]KKT79669.1 MAG: Transposase [Parcubacteria group bacterium GW2011_GWF2_44_8b]